MARSSEGTDQHAQKVIDSADTVREVMFRQVGMSENSSLFNRALAKISARTKVRCPCERLARRSTDRAIQVQHANRPAVNARRREGAPGAGASCASQAATIAFWRSWPVVDSVINSRCVCYLSVAVHRVVGGKRNRGHE